MSHQSHNDSRSVYTSLSKASFGVAGLAFVGSFACAAINSTLSGWMAVAGMAGLGLFYLALGVLNLGHAPKSLFDNNQDPSSAASYPNPRRYGDDLRAPERTVSTRDRATEAQPDELVEA
ncbi:MAG: hypothetical protein DWH84_01045 [Planctomycetota bacterium]|nr:MAG: hypothetical protein DWH84_01045 [Planctomycetota bacterium]